MRVLQVIARMNRGGTSRYLDVLMSGLEHEGISTMLATGFVQGEEVEDESIQSHKSVRIPHLGRRIQPYRDVRAMLELAQTIRLYQPDIIHSHTYKAGLLSRLLSPSIPHVHTFHGHLLDDPDFQGAKRNLVVASERYLARRTDQLVAVGQRVASDLTSAGVGTADQFRSIPPGIDPLPAIDSSTARKDLGLESSEVVVLWLARMTTVKNPWRLMEVARSFPHVTFVMGGGGDLEDVVRQEAPQNVRIMSWIDAALAYAAADIVMSTSHNEGMPIALIEAQLAGLPVVATDVGAVKEVIQDGVTGRVVPSEDLEAALGPLTNSAGLRQHMGLAAQRRAEQLFTRQAMIQAHIGLYQEMLAVGRI